MTIVCLQTLPVLEALRHTEPNTSLYFSNTVSEGKGTLYVDESQLVWWNETDKKGYALAYPSIVCHATCRDTTSFPHACIYCHLDSEGEVQDEDSEPNMTGQEADPRVSELRFVPDNTTALDAIFTVMSECQALHPDEDEEDEDEESEMFYTADNIEELEDRLNNDHKASTQMRHFEDVFQMPSAQQLDEILAKPKPSHMKDYKDMFEDAD